MLLDEIFKEKPDLLEDKEVQKLISYAKENHERAYDILKKYRDFHDFVLDKIMYSELILIDGTSSKETLTEIREEINKV